MRYHGSTMTGHYMQRALDLARSALGATSPNPTVGAVLVAPPGPAAITAAGVAEVHYAMADPDPLVDGGGHRALEAAGLPVTAGEGEAEARRINEAFITPPTPRPPP